jgi:uncharacterized membrane protein YccF (DUF307 family)
MRTIAADVEATWCGLKNTSAAPEMILNKDHVADLPRPESFMDRVRRSRNGRRLGDRGGHLAITIIGIPWARAAFNIASYALLPFGRKAVSRAEYSGHDVGIGPFGLIGNVIRVLAGWWLALGHLITAVLLAVTIIGIPFAWAHLKLAGIALWPIGKEIVAADATPLSHTPPQV